jgi:hypothetical protein
MTCIECGLQPRHKRFHRCRQCMIWKWSFISRKGLLKRLQNPNYIATRQEGKS